VQSSQEVSKRSTSATNAALNKFETFVSKSLLHKCTLNTKISAWYKLLYLSKIQT